MESPGSREFARANHHLKSQIQLAFLFRFLCRFRLDYVRWSRPVMDWYLSFFAPFLVYFVMLSDMEAIRWIASLMKGFSHSVRFDEFFVVSISKYVLFFFIFLCIYLPAKIAPPSFFCCSFIIFLEVDCHPIRHYGEDIERRIFFHRFFTKDCPTLMLVKPIPL